jgi:Protein of unknown function (DUF2764)
MHRGRAYHTLIASLPALPARFDVDRCPITWPRLEDRLKMLAPDDAETLQRLLDFLAWDRQPLDRTDREVIARYKSLMGTVRHPLVRAIIEDRIDMRTIISALRRRRLGWGPPPGLGQWADLIRRRWNQPQFGLQMRFPCIAELDQLMEDGAARDAEKLILSVTWTTWNRASNDYYFSFEAVLLYVARWAIVNSWTSQSAPVGRERFENILAKVLEGHVHFDN